MNDFDSLPTVDEESAVTGIRLPVRACTLSTSPYGAFEVACHYARLPVENNLEIRGEWAHGWHPVEHNVHPQLVIGSTGRTPVHPENVCLWVARKDQAIYLRNHGYRRAQAVGLPILYVERPGISRDLGSLLIIPVHSLDTTEHDWNFQEYVEKITAVREHFSKVVACVYPSCFTRGYWVSAFRKAGIPVITGAHPADRHSLERMALLFSRFDCVTTNGFGSHIPYAAFFGAKVSIYGPIAQYTQRDFIAHCLYQNCPELIPIVVTLLDEEQLRRNYSEFFVDPWRAVERSDWGAWQLGYQHKMTRLSLRRLLMNRKAQFRLLLRNAMAPLRNIPRYL